MRICKHCGSPFSVRDTRMRYCTARCRLGAYAKRRRDGKLDDSSGEWEFCPDRAARLAAHLGRQGLGWRT